MVLEPTAFSSSTSKRSATFFVSLVVTVKRPHMSSVCQPPTLGPVLARRRSHLGVLSIPLDRATQALPQVDLRPPAGHLAQLGAVHVLAVDLALRVAGAADV